MGVLWSQNDSNKSEPICHSTTEFQVAKTQRMANSCEVGLPSAGCSLVQRNTATLGPGVAQAPAHGQADRLDPVDIGTHAMATGLGTWPTHACMCALVYHGIS